MGHSLFSQGGFTTAYTTTQISSRSGYGTVNCLRPKVIARRRRPDGCRPGRLAQATSERSPTSCLAYLDGASPTLGGLRPIGLLRREAPVGPRSTARRPLLARRASQRRPDKVENVIEAIGWSTGDGAPFAGGLN